jgi:F-type H+-transporting ATPase subunit alpha
VTNGFLDDVPVADIREWERAFLEYIHAQWPQVGERLRKEREIKKDLEEDMKRAIAAFKELRGDEGAAKQAPAKRGQAATAR